MFESKEEYKRAINSVALTIANCQSCRSELDRRFIKGQRKISWVVMRKAITDSMLWGDYCQLFEDDKNLFKAEVVAEALHQCGYSTDVQMPNQPHPLYVSKYSPEPTDLRPLKDYVDVKINLYSQSLETTEENPMDHKATHPVMIGNIDILTASDDTLVSLIRKGRKLIKEEADIAATSAKFTKRAALIQSNIDLCNKQLDGETDEPEKS